MRAQPRMWWARTPLLVRWNVPHAPAWNSRGLRAEAAWNCRATTHPMLAFFDEETAAGMLTLVFELVPDEKAWALHVLQTMKTHSGENGWNSNTYAQNMALYLNNGAGHQDRWQKNGRPARGVLPRSRSERKKEKSPSWFAEERLKKNINAALGGLFGRLKELGMIYPPRLASPRITPLPNRVSGSLSNSQRR